jgi:DNA polymerase-3 subunit alpha
LEIVHLHVHSKYSLRDSIIKTSDLVKRLGDIGQNAVAITDHGGSLGGIAIYKKLKENNIKYIHGCEVYICDDTSVKEKNNKYYHLVLLCKNDIGRKNLNKIISISEHPNNKYYKPRIDFEILKAHSDGLIVLSACIAGEICQNLHTENIENAKRIALKYKDLFGHDYYLEIQARNDPIQIDLNSSLCKLSEELSIECVVTTDAHYVFEEDRKYQNKYAFNGAYKEDGESYVDCFVQSEDEIRRNLFYLNQNNVDAAIHNTNVIAAKCNVEMPLAPPIMPHIDTPDTYSSNKQWLFDLCLKGFVEKLNINYKKRCLDDVKRYLSRDEYDDDGNYIRTVEFQLTENEINEYISRYEYEINSLERMGFIDYILLVYSYANVAKRRGIARGSGGGSLVCYLSNITNIDPIEHRLYFERFIDVGALDLLEAGEISAKELKIPDIDLDFSSDSCEEVLKFLYDKYGERNVASIGKFGNNLTKGTIRDMCRVLDIDLQEADQIAKAFENYEIEEIDAMISGSIETTQNAKNAINHVKNYSELFDYVRKLNGLPKSFGLHACGKVISTRDLDEFLPSCYDSEGIRYLQGDMRDVEDVGLVKVDVLGLRTIDQEYDTLEMTGNDYSFIDPKQSFNDPKVLEVFRNGDTTGIFQFSSYGMRQTLKKMNVCGIDDLSIANALFRPGAMSYIDSFCNRRNGIEDFQFLHSDLEQILNGTYGIIVFQEQLIEIGRMAGIRNPDLLRKATGKKDIALLNKVKPELEQKLKDRGWSNEQFSKLWLDMIDFAKYSFNKSHSSSYAIIAYMTAKQKAYYPAEYFAGLCNSYIGKSNYVKEKVADIAKDIDAHKIVVSALNFRNDHRRCSVKDGKIIYAIPLIKDCSVSFAESLYKIRDAGYMCFSDILIDLNIEKVNATQIKIAILLDMFSEYGNSKKLMSVWDMVKLFKFGDISQISKDKIANQTYEKIISRYSRTTPKKYIFNSKEMVFQCIKEIDESIVLDNQEDYSIEEKIHNHMQYLGFVNVQSGNEKDRNNLIVLDVRELQNKDKSRIWGYSANVMSVGSGKKTELIIWKNTYKNSPFQRGNTLYVKKEWLSKDERNGFVNWYLNHYDILDA